MARVHRISLLARATVKEALRARVFVYLLAVAGLIVSASVPAADLSIGDRLRMVEDLSMAGISFVSVFLAVFLGVSAVSGEVDRRTVYTIITKPASRAEFVLGKYFGVLCVVSLGAVICYSFAAVVVTIINDAFPVELLGPLALLILEMALLVALATFFSCLTRPLLSSLFTFCLYVVGTSASSFLYWVERSPNPVFKSLMSGLHAVLPDFEIFDVRTEVVHHLAYPPGLYARAGLYMFLYSSVLLVMGIAIFQRRDLK